MFFIESLWSDSSDRRNRHEFDLLLLSNKFLADELLEQEEHVKDVEEQQKGSDMNNTVPDGKCGMRTKRGRNSNTNKVMPHFALCVRDKKIKPSSKKTHERGFWRTHKDKGNLFHATLCSITKKVKKKKLCYYERLL